MNTNTNTATETDFLDSDQDWIYLVVFFVDGHPCTEVYADIGHAKRAESHIQKAGHAVHIETRSIRGETYLSMIGA